MFPNGAFSTSDGDMATSAGAVLLSVHGQQVMATSAGAVLLSVHGQQVMATMQLQSYSRRMYGQ